MGISRMPVEERPKLSRVVGGVRLLPVLFGHLLRRRRGRFRSLYRSGRRRRRQLFLSFFLRRRRQRDQVKRHALNLVLQESNAALRGRPESVLFDADGVFFGGQLNTERTASVRSPASYAINKNEGSGLAGFYEQRPGSFCSHGTNRWRNGLQNQVHNVACVFDGNAAL